MGLNRNRGQSIHLRLRTDDWNGLRPYEAVVQVRCMCGARAACVVHMLGTRAVHARHSHMRLRCSSTSSPTTVSTTMTTTSRCAAGPWSWPQPKLALLTLTLALALTPALTLTLTLHPYPEPGAQGWPYPAAVGWSDVQTAAANGGIGVPPTEKLDASPAPGIAGDGTGCQSTTAQTVSTEWCINNCAMGNCPMTMCSEDCLRPTEAEIAWAKVL